MNDATLLPVIETALRIIVGVRFLNSGIRNIRMWPYPIEIARIVVPMGAPFFGFLAVCLMTLGGLGLTLGFQTQISAILIMIFLIPTFKVHRHWLRTLPTTLTELRDATKDDLRPPLQRIGRQVIQGQQAAMQNNILLLVLALFFCLRKEIPFALDNLIGEGVIRLF